MVICNTYIYTYMGIYTNGYGYAVTMVIIVIYTIYLRNTMTIMTIITMII